MLTLITHSIYCISINQSIGKKILIVMVFEKSKKKMIIHPEGT